MVVSFFFSFCLSIVLYFMGLMIEFEVVVGVVVFGVLFFVVLILVLMLFLLVLVMGIGLLSMVFFSNFWKYYFDGYWFISFVVFFVGVVMVLVVVDWGCGGI